MENIKEEARKDAEDIWENTLKEKFSEKISQGLKESLEILGSEFSQFNSNISKLFEDIDKKFNEEFKLKPINKISEPEKNDGQHNNFNAQNNNNIVNDVDNDDNEFHILNDNNINKKNDYRNNKINSNNFFNNNNNGINNMNNQNNNNINNNFNINSSNNNNNMNNYNINNNSNKNINSSNNKNNINNQNNNNNVYNNFNMNNSNNQINMSNQNNNLYNNFNNFIINNQSNRNNQNNMNNKNNPNFMNNNNNYNFNNMNNLNQQNNVNNINNMNIQNNNINNMSNQNNMNNSNYNINNLESDESLRKKPIDLKQIHNPSLIILLEPNNSNQLINIILRCISNLSTILAYYFNLKKEEKILQKSKEDPNGAYLGPSFLKLLDNLWKSSKKQYCPMELHSVLKKLMGNDYFSNNPGFIIEFILNQLNKELIDKPALNTDESDDHLNPKLSFQIFFKKFKSCSTKISNCFFSTIKTQKKCISCNQITYFFHNTPVVNIILDSTNKNIFFNQFSLNEHLNNLLMEDKDESINEYCNNCKIQTKKYIMKDIYLTFGLIIFYINREKDPNCQLSFNYPEKFNGKKLINKEFGLYDYQLIIVVKKDPNENNNNGQYLVYCKNFTNNAWYLYNKQDIRIVQNTNEIFDNKNACILIYSEINNKC